MFWSYFGSALFLSLGETILVNRLPAALHHYLPQVSPGAVILAGATNARSAVPPEYLPGLLLAYNRAITDAWVGAALSFYKVSGKNKWFSLTPSLVSHSRRFCARCPNELRNGLA
jgi:hypothetical protein